MSERVDQTLKSILSKPGNGTAPATLPPTLSEVQARMKGKTYQMGFVFVNGKPQNVIIDMETPAMKTTPPPQPHPTNGNGHDYIKPAIYEQVKLAVLAGLTPVIFGPAGSGKSRLAKELAHDIGLKFYTLSFSGGLRYSQVFGSQELSEGNTRWTPAPLLQWIQEPCLILLDEIFSCDPEIGIGLNSLLEPDTKAIMTPAGLIRVNPACKILAASNSNGRQQNRQYTATTRNDDSLLDRLIPPFFMDYDTHAERKIIKPLVSETAAQELTRKLDSLRSQIKTHQIPFDPSTRRLIGACKLVKAGFNPQEAFKMAFMATLSPAELAKIQL